MDKIYKINQRETKCKIFPAYKAMGITHDFLAIRQIIQSIQAGNMVVAKEMYDNMNRKDPSFQKLIQISEENKPLKFDIGSQSLASAQSTSTGMSTETKMEPMISTIFHQKDVPDTDWSNLKPSALSTLTPESDVPDAPLPPTGLSPKEIYRKQKAIEKAIKKESRGSSSSITLKDIDTALKQLKKITKKEEKKEVGFLDTIATRMKKRREEMTGKTPPPPYKTPFPPPLESFRPPSPTKEEKNDLNNLKTKIKRHLRELKTMIADAGPRPSDTDFTRIQKKTGGIKDFIGELPDVDLQKDFSKQLYAYTHPPQKKGSGCRRGKGTRKLKLQPIDPTMTRLSLLSGEITGGNKDLKSILMRELKKGIKKGILTKKQAKRYL